MGSCASVEDASIEQQAAPQQLRHNKTPRSKRRSDAKLNNAKSVDDEDPLSLSSHSTLNPDAGPPFDVASANEQMKAWFNSYLEVQGKTQPSLEMLRHFERIKEKLPELDNLFDNCRKVERDAQEDGAVSSLDVEKDAFGAGAFESLMAQLEVTQEAHLFHILAKIASPVVDEWLVHREQWRKGWLRCCAYCLADAKAFSKKASLRYESLKITDAEFKDTYRFVYRFAKKPARKAMPRDDAVMIWQTMVGERWELLSPWCKYAGGDTTSSPSKTVITLDQWDQLVEFAAVTSAADIDSYDTMTSPWPSLIDGFCEWAKQARADGEL